ncbi:hypothetical protein [Krasilnikovia sp. MM14-A1004]|uniref:hypothetical protein n=1 Tax=Krasilnikovia sp. MM14-A1004 TaxID=3373541 RepID=UPI00399C5848
MLLSKKLLALTAGAIASSAAVVGLSINSASAESASDPKSLVEDYSYPNADKILAERGIKLIRGSGTIMLADCPATPTNNDLIWVATLKGNVCFKATSSTGFLSLAMDEVYSLRGDDHKASATVTVDGETEQHNLKTGVWKGVGVGEDENKPLATLLEIRVNP